MKKILLTASAGLLLSASVFAAEKIVAIDSVKIMQESKEGQEITLKLQKKAEKIGELVKSAQKELADMQENLNKKAKVLSPEALQEKTKQIARKKTDAERDIADKEEAFGAELKGYQYMLVQKQRQIIQEVAKKEDWVVVVDPNTPGVLFVSNAIDKTDVVLKAVDDKYMAGQAQTKTASTVATAKNDTPQATSKEIKVA